MEPSDSDGTAIKVISGLLAAVSLLALPVVGLLALYAIGWILSLNSGGMPLSLGGVFWVIWAFCAFGIAITNVICALNNFRDPSWKPVIFIGGSSFVITFSFFILLWIL